MIDLKSLKPKVERDDWGQHPFTQYLAREFRSALLERANDRLLGSCAVSTDPKVTKALAEYQAVLAFAEFLEQSGREKE